MDEKSKTSQAVGANDISLIARMETKCTGCGACVNACPQGTIYLVERKVF